MVDDGTDNMQILIDDLYFYNFFSRSETANLFAVLFELPTLYGTYSYLDFRLMVSWLKL